ncbi:hypothetical protein CHLRE_07g347650v5 [Chlamydomonas reinhardtii]|uniref:Uncharacterized protein n=1 Tax=Chlamydomonas reinhardtii TaxID=3055 RepID=A0A2K3DL23_CHLRE|nr:uncharacterized protein CHLRE_07g347650v5 [Chlamydomonas reinhardtii]PNW81235.1 hypothetical protein CHLRE_07g347650v5 [Chlamydomonas reinhardtii]
MRRQALKRLGRRQPPQQQLLLLRSSNPRHGVAPQLPGATAAAFGALVVAALVLGAAVAAPLPAAAATAAGPATAAAAAGGPQCASPCFTVADYWPYKTCRAECAPEICSRGWGAWPSREQCCAEGAAFPDGCSVRPKECWVVESAATRTCIRDDRKCLQGYGVYASQAACCAPGTAFPDGCAPPPPPSAQPCWVVDTYFPARLCRQSTTLCAAKDSGVQSWPSKDACCAKAGAFKEGCSAAAPPTPCYTVGEHWPKRTCELSTDIAVCNRGWGVYGTAEVCCSPGVAFPEGCSAPAAPAGPAATATPAAAAAAALQPKAAAAAPAAPLTAATAALPKRAGGPAVTPVEK